MELNIRGRATFTPSLAEWSGQLLGVDAVREFNVETGTYGTQYGRRAGSQISMVTMSGSNQLHGTAFEFLRNGALDAKNYFDHPACNHWRH